MPAVHMSTQRMGESVNTTFPQASVGRAFPVITASKVQRVIILGKERCGHSSMVHLGMLPQALAWHGFRLAHHSQTILLHVTLDTDIGGVCGWELSVLDSIVNPLIFELEFYNHQLQHFKD